MADKLNLTKEFFRYIASRIFLHNPPGEDNAFRPTADAPKELHQHEEHLLHAEPKVNPWFCTVFLLVTIAIMAVTAEMVCTTSLLSSKIIHSYFYL